MGCLSIRPDRPTDRGVEELARFASEGIRIRPRALVTTALCRTLLADLFVHGIGGAIYDELGDSIFKTFFGITPPAYAVMSATLRIDDFGPAQARDELDVAIRHRRCLEWKSETLGLTDPSVKILLEQKQYWLEQATLEREPRRKRARELRRINREIAVLLAGSGAKLGKDIVGEAFKSSLKSYKESYSKQAPGSDPILAQLEKDMKAIATAPVIEGKGGNVFITNPL
jgi:hypothetical protein